MSGALLDQLFGETGLLSPSCAAISLSLANFDSLASRKLQDMVSPALMRHIGPNLVKLSIRGMTGFIPEAIGDNCVNLQIADFAGNPLLTGPIPENWDNLRKLQIVFLYDTGISGPIPSSFFRSATELRRLNLSNTNISGQIPESVGLLTKLKELRLDDTSISGRIPKTLAKLTNLTHLYLDGTQIEKPEGASKMWVDNNEENPTAVADFLALLCGSED